MIIESCECPVVKVISVQWSECADTEPPKKTLIKAHIFKNWQRSQTDS